MAHPHSRTGLYDEIDRLRGLMDGVIARFQKRAAHAMAHDGSVVIDMSGRQTKDPKVHVSVHSARGSISLFTQAATESGHARAELTAKSLSHILSLPIVDQREKAGRRG